MILRSRKNYIFILISLLFNTFIFAQNITIIKPSENIGIDNWNIVNDGVMGGISHSSIYLNENFYYVLKEMEIFISSALESVEAMLIIQQTFLLLKMSGLI